jgi:amino acid transporter
MAYFDPSQAKTLGTADAVVNADSSITYNDGDTWFLGGIVGIFQALPSSAWWFTGLECISLATKEARNVRKDVPTGLYASWGILSVCMLLLSIFCVLMPPGLKYVSWMLFIYVLADFVFL